MGSGQFSADEVAQYAKLLQPSAASNPVIRGGKSILKGIEFINQLTEMAPRVSEFNYVLEKTGDVQKALRASQEVTVNFSRGGDVAKQLEPYVPYFNASVQGIDRFVRAFDVIHDTQGAMKRMAKAGLVITLPAIASYIMCMMDDEEKYKSLDQRTKDTNFIFPLEGDKYLKIPKSREVGVLFATLFERTLAKDFRGFGGVIATNFFPVNPFENNIFAPAVINLPMNKDFAGRTIVPDYMKKYSPRYQYDDNTSEISKALGNIANVSPKQIDYIAKSYFGIVSQLLLPATTGRQGAVEGIKKVAVNPFVADTAFSSQPMTNFYEALSKAERVKADQSLTVDERITTPEEIAYRNLSKMSLAISKATKHINQELRQDDPKVKEIRQIINNYTKQAVKESANVVKLTYQMRAELYKLGVR